jgi:hypothetical protein
MLLARTMAVLTLGLVMSGVKEGGGDLVAEQAGFVSYPPCRRGIG